MRKLSLVALLLACPAAYAAEVRLKCTTSEGTPVVSDLVINVEAKKIQWGGFLTYRIGTVTERFITAFAEYSDTGGEVLVLDRVTGAYERGHVAVMATEFSRGRPLNEKLTASAYSGVCRTAIL